MMINMPTNTPTAIYKLDPKGCTILEINEFKKSIILWAQNQATGHRTQAAIGHTKHHHDKHTAKAETMDFIAKYLEGMEIIEQSEPPKPVRICQDTNKPCEENCGIPDCYLKLCRSGAFDVN